MTTRTARRLTIARYERWLMRHHPDSVAPPCLIRDFQRRELRKVKRMTSDPVLRAALLSIVGEVGREECGS